jgi:hypothetical protein
MKPVFDMFLKNICLTRVAQADFSFSRLYLRTCRKCEISCPNKPRSVMFSKIKVCRTAGRRRTAGYQPAMSAKREHLCGSPHASKGETLKIRPKKPGTTRSHERTRNYAEAEPSSGLTLSPLLRAGFCKRQIQNPKSTRAGFRIARLRSLHMLHELSRVL